MVSTTMGVRLDDETRERIKAAAQKIDRTPHWLIRQAIFDYLAQLDSLPDGTLPAAGTPSAQEDDTAPAEPPVSCQPFLEFAGDILPQSVTRAAITSAYRIPEPEAVAMLLPQAQLSWMPHRPPINWLTVWQKSCVIRKTAADAPGWYRDCFRNSPSPPRRGSR